jgi:hypothetical protein
MNEPECLSRISGLLRLAPSLRQYELDQVQRVTALREPAESQPLVGTPLVSPKHGGGTGVVSTAFRRGRENAKVGGIETHCGFEDDRIIGQRY